MKSFNAVHISGRVLDGIEYGRTGNQSNACSFTLASDRTASGGEIITVTTKVNVYVEGLLRICKLKLAKGCYVVVLGELMNRDGIHGVLTEVRARDILFFTKLNPDGDEA